MCKTSAQNLLYSRAFSSNNFFFKCDLKEKAEASFMVTFCVVCFRKSRRRAPPTGGRCWTPPQFMSLSPLSRPYRLLKQWPPPAIRQRCYRRGRPRPVLSKRPSKINPRRWRAKDKQILLSMSHPERKTRRLKALSLIGSLA